MTAPAYPGRRFGGAVTDVSPRLGAKTIQSGAPTEKRDASVLDVLVTLDPGTVLPIGLRVDCYVVDRRKPDMTCPPRPAIRAVFTQGSILRHVAVMTLTSAVGLMAIFLIDLMSMFYVSMAHRDAWRAAVSLMSKVLFFPFALNMGMMIGIGTVVSIAIGRGDRDLARRSASTGLVLTGLLGLGASLAALPFRVEILHLFGAEGEALDAASRLLVLTLPVNVFLSVGMACASILRAGGDPTRAMLVTLAGGVATALADPLFIFGFGQGIDGVGMAIVLSRFVFVLVGLWFVVKVHRFVVPIGLRLSLAGVRPIAMIALPAIATNLALPFADWYVTRTIWQFGVAASAAAGVYDRIMPFAFSLVFALTHVDQPDHRPEPRSARL